MAAQPTRDPEDVAKIARLMAENTNLKEEVVLQRGRADTLDKLNDVLLDSRVAMWAEWAAMTGSELTDNNMRRRFFESAFSTISCSCGKCAQCAAQEGMGMILAARQPTGPEDALKLVEDFLSVCTGKYGEHEFVTMIKTPGRAPEGARKFSVQRCMVVAGNGAPVPMLVLLAGEDNEIMQGDRFLHDSVAAQIAELMGKFGSGDNNG